MRRFRVSEGNFVAPLGSSERVLSSGQVVVPGEPIALDDEATSDEHNKRLIEEGQLLEVQEQKKSKKSGGDK
jgi:hypothetical protein